ncbi:MAG: endoglucanase-related protein glucosyl hydrolase family 9 protein, partial [Chloroflexota bacterium]
MRHSATTRVLSAVLCVLCMVVMSYLTIPAPTSPSARAAHPAHAAARRVGGRAIPTTTSPTIDVALAGARIVANTSFERQTNACESGMRGWLTSHPVMGSCRVFEIWDKNAAHESLVGSGAPDGTYYIELNASYVSMAYQPICMVGGETFDFEFYHHVRSWSDTNVIDFRFGIPTGLPAGSRPADSYERQILRGTNVLGASGSTATASITQFTGTTGGTSAVQTSPMQNWVRFAGTHTIAAEFGGVRNLGFYGISPANSASANLLDKISINLIPLIDMGGSTDQAADEQGTVASIKIRINGHVSAGTKLALRRNTADPGTATSDTDFVLGTVDAGANGTATVTHTSGSDLWLIDVPVGDYDGGKISANDQMGLSIPVEYTYDLTSEATEYAFFELAAPGEDGASAATAWNYVAPTCDGSFKDDGVVYTITNTVPTSTPTLTPTRTFTPTATPTPSGQTITFAAPTGITTGSAPFPAGATASSGLAVTYESTTPSVCTVTSTGTVTVVGPGTCTLVAHQIGGVRDGVTYTAAPDVTRTFIIPAAQAITFPPISDKAYIVPDFLPNATASSTLPVSYSSSTPDVCIITGGKIHLLSIGDCTVTAAQPGGTSGGVLYAAATPVSRTFAVTGAPQVITAPPVPQKHTYDGPFDLAAVSDSGLPVEYESLNPAICTVSGKKVTIIGPGTCYVKAKQPGAEKDGVIYRAAVDVVIPINITNATATSTPTATRTATPTPHPNALKKAAVGASFVLGLLYNGTLTTWGMNKEYQTNIPPCCANNITDVSVGTNFAVALKGGRVYAWGANTRGQLNVPLQAQKDVVAVSSGYAHTLALKLNGTLVCWGSNEAKQCTIPKTATNVVQAAGGQYYSLALLKSGKVIGWGSNEQGQIKIPAGLSAVKAITAGCTHAMALKS